MSSTPKFFFTETSDVTDSSVTQSSSTTEPSITDFTTPSMILTEKSDIKESTTAFVAPVIETTETIANEPESSVTTTTKPGTDLSTSENLPTEGSEDLPEYQDDDSVDEIPSKSSTQGVIFPNISSTTVSSTPTEFSGMTFNDFSKTWV